MSNVLEVKGLCVSYGGIQAVKDISFVVPKGDVVTLIGANGNRRKNTGKYCIPGDYPCSGRQKGFR